MALTDTVAKSPGLVLIPPIKASFRKVALATNSNFSSSSDESASRNWPELIADKETALGSG